MMSVDIGGSLPKLCISMQAVKGDVLPAEMHIWLGDCSGSTE